MAKKRHAWGGFIGPRSPTIGVETVFRDSRGETAVMSVSLRAATSDDGLRWWALISAALAPVVLISAWLLAGVVQPPTYRPLRQTISSLAGPAATNRWIMTAGLFAVGACYLATAIGLTGVVTMARLLLVLAGVAAAGLALSPVPTHGSTPRHLAWTVVGAAVITIWPIFARHRAPPHSLILSKRATLTAAAVFVVLLAWTLVETQLGQRLGLAERLSTAVQTCWPLVIAVALQREKRGGESRAEPWSTKRSVAPNP